MLANPNPNPYPNPNPNPNPYPNQVAARLCSLDLRSSDADLLRDSKPSSSQAQAGETLLL